MFRSVTAESRTPVRQKTTSRSRPSKLVNTSAPSDPSAAATGLCTHCRTKPNRNRTKASPSATELTSSTCSIEICRGTQPILRGRQQMRQPVVVQRLAAQKRIARRDVALAHLGHDRHAPGHVGREIRAVGAPLRHRLGDMRKWQPDDRRHRHEQEEDATTVGPAECWWREHSAHQPAGERRDCAAEQRNDEQHRPAHARHPESEQHEAAEAVAPDRTHAPRSQTSCRERARTRARPAGIQGR